MYEVGALRRVVINVAGEELSHYFDDLRGDEWLEFQRRVSAVDGDDRQLRSILLGYDARIKKVEGYVFDGRDLMEARPDDWRALIPGGHKLDACVELASGNDLKKN